MSLAATQPSACCGLRAVPESVKTGRDFTRSMLLEWELPDLADMAELVVSELLTNALRHGIASGPGAPPASARSGCGCSARRRM